MALSQLTPGIVAGIFGALIGGAVLHELTHAATARLVGARVHTVDLWGLEVVYELPVTDPMWKDRVINLAPQLVGGSVAAGYLGVVGVPALSVGSAVALLGWTCYTLFGGLEDYSLAVAQDDTSWWDELHPRTRQTSVAVVSLAIGEACLFVIPPAVGLAYPIERVVTGLGVALVISSVGVVALPARERSAPTGG